MGVSDNAAIVDVEIVIETIKPRGLNISPVRPPIMVRGRNTATTVRVVAITARATSLVP